MDVLYNLLFLLLLAIVIGLLIIRLRTKLLSLWKEVSYREIIFHRLLSETIIAFYKQKDELKNEDNRLHFVRLGRSRKKKARHLLLKERQELYLYLSYIHNEIEELDTDKFNELKHQFNRLQKARRIYNSKVLLYNQSISVFPTRLLAVKLNLKTKEYFG